LESWSIAAKLSPHIDDDVALGARCVAAVIATKTVFSDTLRATVLRSDEGYLPILVPQLGLPEHVLHSYLAGTGNGEDIPGRLANLVSFVCLTVKFARNMEASLRALTTAQRNVILSERERLREVRSTRPWDFAADGESNSLSTTPERISPPSPWRPITGSRSGGASRRLPRSVTTSSRRCNATPGLSATEHTAFP
jgi:hypothetical protein